MTKKFCDRCGKEITKKLMHRSVFDTIKKQFKTEQCDVCLYQELEQYGSKRTGKWELCHDCADALEEFMKGK